MDNGSATKWASTPHAETWNQREDAHVWQQPKPAALNKRTGLMPPVAPLAKGQIQEVMGGNRGSSKFVKGSATKWAGTRWEEPNHA